MSEPSLRRPAEAAGPGGRAPRVPAQTRREVRGRRCARRERRPSGPVLFDWAVEVPEWRRSERAAPADPPTPAGPEDPASSALLYELPELATAAEPPARAASPGPPNAAPAPRSGVAARWRRLTRRGRVVVVSALSAGATLALSLFFLTAVAGGASASGAPAASFMGGPAPASVVVDDGDTLWEIAERTRPSEDPRRTMHEIAVLNDLRGSELRPGQVLELPAP